MVCNTRKARRGGGKFTGLYNNKNNNKTERGAKPSTLKSKTIQHKSYLKTLKKPTLHKKVTPDKYIQGIIKFLNKILSAKVNNKSYELYQNTSLNIYVQIDEAMKGLGISMRDYDTADLDDFIEDLRDLLESLIETYHSANTNDKANVEIQMYTLANPIMDAIKETKKEGKITKINDIDELADLLGGMTFIMPPKKNNKSVMNLADLFSKTGLL